MPTASVAVAKPSTLGPTQLGSFSTHVSSGARHEMDVPTRWTCQNTIETAGAQSERHGVVQRGWCHPWLVHRLIGAGGARSKKVRECLAPVPAARRPQRQKGATNARVHKDEMREVEPRARLLGAHPELAQQRAVCAVVKAVVSPVEGEEAACRVRPQVHRTDPAVYDERKEDASARRLRVTRPHRMKVLKLRARHTRPNGLWTTSGQAADAAAYAEAAASLRYRRVETTRRTFCRTVGLSR